MTGMEDKEVKKLVNECFEKRGYPKVKNFAQEFSDGSKSTPDLTFSRSPFPNILQYPI